MIKNHPVRVFIADDQPEVCSALRLLFENQDNEWCIAGEARDFSGLLEAARQHTPDVILLDWELPGLSELSGRDARGQPERLEKLRSLGGQVAIIAISGYWEARAQADAAGVDGFISKTEPPDRFLETVKLVGLGR